VKSVILGFALFVACSAFAEPKQWSKREAVAEADHDICSNDIKFCYWGGFAPRPVGVPDEYLNMVVAKYPKVMVGQGCIVSDEALNERQRLYAETYNTRMLADVLKKK
jgi:hypothetical protein